MGREAQRGMKQQRVIKMERGRYREVDEDTMQPRGREKDETKARG